MKFDKVLGVCDPKLILESQNRLSSTFTELATNYTAKIFGSKIGGDIFLHQMISPLKQICDARAIEFKEESDKILQSTQAANGTILTQEDKSWLVKELKTRLGDKLIYTAATNGKECFWNPQFIIERSPIGLRLVVGHEGSHIIYMHPSRRGARNPALWNISVDFKVNFVLIDDLRLRKFYHAEEIFRKELGDFITLNEYIGFLKDPFNPPNKLAAWNPMHTIKRSLNPNYESGQQVKSLYYAEPKLHDDFRKPEVIYDFLMSHVPKCTTCGKLGVWKKPEEYQKLVKQLKEKTQDESNHDH